MENFRCFFFMMMNGFCVGGKNTKNPQETKKQKKRAEEDAYGFNEGKKKKKTFWLIENLSENPIEL